MDYTDEHFYMLALSFVKELTAYQKIRILEEKGSAEVIFNSYRSTCSIPKLSGHLLDNYLKIADKECELMHINKIETVFATNSDFPFRLNHCPDHPLALFYKGKLDVNRKYALSIVGSRKADKRGERHIHDLLEFLIPYKDKLVIVAGIASGVDSMVLNFANKLGLYTVCVIPHGFGHIYDSNVTKRIKSASCVISENSFHSGYGEKIYEQRNRIIVGMSDAVVVAQAKNGNGSGLYIGKAIDYNRDAFAYVYSDDADEKCNQFIANDEAIPLNSTEEFFEKMIWPW